MPKTSTRIYLAFLRGRWVIGMAVVAAAILVTPLLMQAAYEQRGYFAIGGEMAPLVLAENPKASIQPAGGGVSVAGRMVI